MADRSSRSVRLRVIVSNGPAGAGDVFGLQDKAGSIASGAGRPDGRRVFECQVVARRTGAAEPNILGPFTHGTPASRHLYLSHRSAAAGLPWIKRIKVPLSSITWVVIEEAGEGVLETEVDGRRSGAVPVSWRIAS